MLAGRQIMWDMSLPEKKRKVTFGFTGTIGVINHMLKLDKKGKKDPNREKVGLFDAQIGPYKDAE